MNENEINKSHLAQLMLDWEKAQRRADELAAAIKDTVSQLGETQKVGYVTASYSGGRTTYDYGAAVRAFVNVTKEKLDFAPFKTTKVTTDFRAACKAFGIEDVPFTKSAPSVTLKLEEK